MRVPLLVHTKVLRDLLLEEPFNKKHFQELANLDIAIVGLGLLDAILPNTSDTWYNFTTDKEELRGREKNKTERLQRAVKIPALCFWFQTRIKLN